MNRLSFLFVLALSQQLMVAPEKINRETNLIDGSQTEILTEEELEISETESSSEINFDKLSEDEMYAKIEITEDDRNFFINLRQMMSISKESDKDIEESLLYKTELE